MLERQRTLVKALGISQSSWRRGRVIRITIIAIIIFLLATYLVTSMDASRPKSDTQTANTPNLLARLIGKAKELVDRRMCKGWDPSHVEAPDPVRCMRARRYRQVQRLLAREIKAEHDRWYFAKTANIATLERLSRCYLPTSHPEHTPCPDRPLILNGYWWSAMTIHNSTSGETIWQSSILKELDTFGIMTLFVGPYTNMITTTELLPDVYRFVWGSDADIVSCLTDPRCIASEHYVPPEGAEDLSIGVPDSERGVIPIWRLQIADYWGARPMEGDHGELENWSITRPGDWSFHSLGSSWVQTPWPLPEHFHLPYSIEEYCLNTTVIPHEERENTVLVLAKYSDYFHDMHALYPETWSDLANEPNFTMISTAEVRKGSPAMPEELKSIGRQTRAGYESLLGSVKVLLGMGLPRISPSVYTALCQGTPAVFPYMKEKSELSKGGWEVFSVAYQHAPAMALGPPYVYSYYIDDYEEMVEMINSALTTPIGRYIPDDMQLPYVRSQLRTWLDRDLHKLFKAVIRNNGGKVPPLMAGLRDQCRARERCAEPFPAGRRPSTPERIREEESLRKGEEILLT